MVWGFMSFSIVFQSYQAYKGLSMQKTKISLLFQSLTRLCCPHEDDLAPWPKAQIILNRWMDDLGLYMLFNSISSYQAYKDLSMQKTKISLLFQSLPRLCCPHEEDLGPWPKTQIY